MSEIFPDGSIEKLEDAVLSIRIMQAYLKAVAVFPVADGKTVADLLFENDHKLWFALQTAGVG